MSTPRSIGYQRSAYISVTVLWVACIFFVSSIPDLRSSLPTRMDFIVRKIAHAVEFGVLYFLVWKSFEGIRERTALSFAITVAYAIFDESYQNTVPGRVGSPVDVVIDSLGAVIANSAIMANRRT